MTATQKLIETITNYGTVINGNVSVKNGQKYRYDLVESNIKNTPYWMALIFNKAAQETGNEYKSQFKVKLDTLYSFNFERASTKGELNGKISFTKLVFID